MHTASAATTSSVATAASAAAAASHFHFKRILDVDSLGRNRLIPQLAGPPRYPLRLLACLAVPRIREMALVGIREVALAGPKPFEIGASSFTVSWPCFFPRIFSHYTFGMHHAGRTLSKSSVWSRIRRRSQNLTLFFSDLMFAKLNFLDLISAKLKFFRFL